MSTVIYSSLLNHIEQGSINEWGYDSDSSTSLRLIGKFPAFEDMTSVTVSATCSTGKQLQMRFIGYDSSNNSVIDLWGDATPSYSFDVTSQLGNLNKLRLCFKYSDDSDILPSEITSCSMTYISSADPWHITNNILVNNAPPRGGKAFSAYPTAMYRVEYGVLKHGFLPALTPRFQTHPDSMYYVNNLSDLVHGFLPEKDFSPEVIPFLKDNRNINSVCVCFGDKPTYFTMFGSKYSRNVSWKDNS